IAWRSIRQNQTALSSCEAEILATNECVVDLLSIRHRMADLGMPDADSTTSVYNDNRGAVDWSKNVTNKGIKHFNLKENKVQEVHASGDVVVTHIQGEINSSDIFKKEMNDSAHFRRLHDSFMVSRANFLCFSHNVPSEIGGKTPPFYSPTYVSDDDDGAADNDEIWDDVDDVSGAASCDKNSAPSGRDLPLATARRSTTTTRRSLVLTSGTVGRGSTPVRRQCASVPRVRQVSRPCSQLSYSQGGVEGDWFTSCHVAPFGATTRPSSPLSPVVSSYGNF
ncbi:hypothetical protein ACHAWF_000317, partial [Thalassiosira exigua]